MKLPPESRVLFTRSSTDHSVGSVILRLADGGGTGRRCAPREQGSRMGEARFVFVSDEEGEGDEDSAARVWWRLVAANNRVLGRLAGTAPGVRACRARAAELRDRVHDAISTLTTDERGRWTWTMALDGAEVAHCAHPFARRVDCVRTLTLFTEGIRASDPDAGTVLYPMGDRYLPRPSRVPAPVTP